jgi:hypothetical protein
VEAWFRLPSPDWAGSLVNLALAIVSAAGAIYSAAVVPWLGELDAAMRSTRDDNGKRFDPASAEAARARRRVREIRGRDPAKGLGVIVLVISIPMAALGIVAGLQIPESGYVYTVLPVVVAAVVAVGAALLPGRQARRDADALLGTSEVPAKTRQPE